MENPIRCLRLAEALIPYIPRYPETPRYFASYDCPEPERKPDLDQPVRLSEGEWQRFVSQGMEPCPHSEYSVLTFPISDALMALDRIVIHAVALRWRDKAWLICAKSGVGKSTQARWLQKLRPGEFGVISGDRPILEFLPARSDCHSERRKESVPPCHSERSEESVPPCHSERSEESVPPSPFAAAAIGRQPPAPILVHPSPWNGKENWYGAPAAPLAGVILLERGEENKLCALSPWDAVIPLYTKLIQTTIDPELLVKAGKLEQRILNSVPVWRLVTEQVPASTQVLLESVFPSIPAQAEQGRQAEHEIP